MAIKRKPEWSAEGGERAFGGVGFGRFQSNVVDLARHASATFAGAMALADDGQTIGLDADPNLGDVDSKESPALFAGQDTAALNRFSAPAIEAKDPVRLGDRVPTLNVGQFAAVSFTAAQMTSRQIPAQRFDLRP